MSAVVNSHNVLKVIQELPPQQQEAAFLYIAELRHTVDLQIPEEIEKAHIQAAESSLEDAQTHPGSTVDAFSWLQ